MTEHITKTSERVIPEKFGTKEEYLIYLRHLFAYRFAKEKIPANSVVLEVGFGEGYGTSMLSSTVVKITGLDVDKNVVIHAREKYGSENCIYTLYDGLTIPFEDNVFDAVISFQVIEHVKNDENYISEIHRVLKRNGVFILTTPNGTLRIKRGQRPWNRYHVREYYPEELYHMLNGKFQEVTVCGISGNEEVQKTENERVKKSRRIASFDPLDLRRFIPGTMKQMIFKIFKGMAPGKPGQKSNRDFLDKYSLEDYYITETRVNDSMDLLGIVTK